MAKHKSIFHLRSTTFKIGSRAAVALDRWDLKIQLRTKVYFRFGFAAGATVSTFLAGGAAERWRNIQEEQRLHHTPCLPIGPKVG